MDTPQDSHIRRRDAPPSTQSFPSANGSSLMAKEVDPVSALQSTGQARNFHPPQLVISKAIEALHAVVHTTPAWLNFGIMVSLIFGGCCSNVRKIQRMMISLYTLQTTDLVYVIGFRVGSYREVSL